MILNKKICGISCDLRSVQIKDAEFILSLRLDGDLNQYLNKVDDDVSKQEEWITRQMQSDGDYYFIIESKSGESLGTISLYNINEQHAEFGRWISKGGAVQNIESVILLHGFGFESLGLNKIYSRTAVENKKVLGFHKRFGAIVTQEITKAVPSGLKLQMAFIDKDKFEEIERRNSLIVNEIYEN